MKIPCFSTISYLWRKNSIHLLNQLKADPYNTHFCLQKYSNETMGKILNVAEKNDAAKNISAIISKGGSTRREGFSKFNKIYEFEAIVHGERSHMTMTSVSGHLLTHSFTGNFKKWHGCNPIQLFDAPVTKVCIENMHSIKQTLESEAKKANKLIIWTDCDREGENIGFEIISVCKAVNPTLSVYRAKFSEITSNSVQQALCNLGSPDERQNDAVEVRSELDLRIGAAFTRFQTLRLQKVFPSALADILISYGSCQFPTLGFVVERYKAIQNFIPESFWKIKVTHEVENNVVEFVWKRVRLFDELVCQVLLEKCLESGEAVVQSTNSRPKSKWRPLPLDTIELEKLSSRKLKISAKETMRIAEKLYTGGFISYPRTETNIFPPNFDLASLIEMQVQDPNWGEFARGIETPTPRQGKKSDQAHPPIHPTKYAPNLQGNEKKIYEFIVRHFLACCSADAKGMETIVQIKIGEEEFTTSGLIILERNYLEVYPYERWSDKEMPTYHQGQKFDPSIEMVTGQTSPPPLLTEADLIALMEKHGIGTDATHAEHIETIKSRQYVGLQNSKFVPGELGMGLVEGYDAMGFHMSKPNLRAELEADLKRICEGTRDPKIVLAEQILKYKNVFENAWRQAKKIDEALARLLNEAPNELNASHYENISNPKVVICPRCSSDIVVKKKKDGGGLYLSCTGFPDCKMVLWLPSTVKHIDVTDESCRQCGGSIKKLRFSFTPSSYSPLLPDQYTTCVGGCDHHFLNTLGIEPFPPKGFPRDSTIASSTHGRYTSNIPPSLSSADSGYSSSVPRPSSQSVNSLNERAKTSMSRSSQFMNSQTSRENAQFPVSGRVGHSYQMSSEEANKENAVVCNCNLNALKLTVRKEGPNTGRQFYKCAKPQGEGCNFFIWTDDVDEATPFTDRSSATNRTAYKRNNNEATNISAGNGENNTDDVQCNCGLTAKRLTTQKEGANKGRQFYCCAKSRDQQCGFFKWADEEQNAPQFPFNNANTMTSSKKRRVTFDISESSSEGSDLEEEEENEVLQKRRASFRKNKAIQNRRSSSDKGLQRIKEPLPAQSQTKLKSILKKTNTSHFWESSISCSFLPLSLINSVINSKLGLKFYNHFDLDSDKDSSKYSTTPEDSLPTHTTVDSSKESTDTSEDCPESQSILEPSISGNYLGQTNLNLEPEPNSVPNLKESDRSAQNSESSYNVHINSSHQIEDKENEVFSSTDEGLNQSGDFLNCEQSLKKENLYDFWSIIQDDSGVPCKTGDFDSDAEDFDQEFESKQNKLDLENQNNCLKSEFAYETDLVSENNKRAQVSTDDQQIEFKNCLQEKVLSSLGNEVINHPNDFECPANNYEENHTILDKENCSQESKSEFDFWSIIQGEAEGPIKAGDFDSDADDSSEDLVSSKLIDNSEDRSKVESETLAEVSKELDKPVVSFVKKNSDDCLIQDPRYCENDTITFIRVSQINHCFDSEHFEINSEVLKETITETSLVEYEEVLVSFPPVILIKSLNNYLDENSNLKLDFVDNLKNKSDTIDNSLTKPGPIINSLPKKDRLHRHRSKSLNRTALRESDDNNNNTSDIKRLNLHIRSGNIYSELPPNNFHSKRPIRPYTKKTPRKINLALKMASDTPAFSLDINCAGEPELLSPSKRDDIKEKDILIWIYNMIDEPARVDYEFFLKDGCIICKLMNRIVPGCIPEEEITWEGARSKQKNIANFLAQAEKYGVPKAKLFFAEDLLHLRHIPRVTRCLYALAKLAQDDPSIENCPRIGDEPNFMEVKTKVEIPGHRDTKDVLNQLTTTLSKKEEEKKSTKHSLYK